MPSSEPTDAPRPPADLDEAEEVAVPRTDPPVTVIAVVAGEPAARVAGMLASLRGQDTTAPIELIVAAPPEDHPALTRMLEAWTRDLATLVANPGGSRSRGLNECLARATGEIVVRVDARSRVPADYVRRCVDRLEADPDIGAVGGHQVATAPPGAGVRARGIARALRNRILLGGASYRSPHASGPADTVYLGAFRRTEAAALAYDERLAANEDFDLCARYRAAGRTVFLEPGLAVAYEPRTNFGDLGAQYRAFGRAKVGYWRARRTRPHGRQAVALGLVPAAALGAVVISAKWPRVLPALAVGGVGAYLAADAVGTGEPAPLTTRLAAAAAHVVVESAWIAGVLGALVRPARSGDVEHPLQRDAGHLGGGLVDHDLVHHLATGQ